MDEHEHVEEPDRTIFSTIPEAIEEIRAGRIVLVVDDADRENEGDFIMAAEACTPEAVNFMVTHGRGIVCLPCAAWRLDELGIPQMVTDTTDGHEAAFTVSIDYRHGTTTGTSANDRAITARAVTQTDVVPRDFQKPGHVFPLRAKDGGVLRRAGHTEAAVDLVDAGRHVPGGRDLRGHERRRDDGPDAGADPCCPGARPEADLDRGPDRVPTTARGARRTGGGGGDPDLLRRVPLLRVREPRRWPHPRGARDGGDRRRCRRADPRALRMPHRRRVRLACGATAVPSSTDASN